MSSNNLERDAQQAKKDASNKANEAYDNAQAEAKKLEKKASDAAKRGEKKAEEWWKTFSSDPKYWATTLGLVNAALVAGVGIFAYQNQDQVKSWDKRAVGAISAGVLTLIGGQTYFAVQKAEEQL